MKDLILKLIKEDKLSEFANTVISTCQKEVDGITVRVFPEWFLDTGHSLEFKDGRFEVYDPRHDLTPDPVLLDFSDLVADGVMSIFDVLCVTNELIKLNK